MSCFKSVHRVKSISRLKIQFRVYSLYFLKKMDLPPTSASIQLYIRRAYYNTYTQLNCLKKNCDILNPLNFGYVLDDVTLVPRKINDVVPPTNEFVPNYLCKKCSTRACRCAKAEVACCDYCACFKMNIRQNINNN